MSEIVEDDEPNSSKAGALNTVWPPSIELLFEDNPLVLTNLSGTCGERTMALNSKHW